MRRFARASGKQSRSPELKRNLPAVLMDLHYAHRGKTRERFLAGQSEQAWCLTVPTNSVVTWTTMRTRAADQAIEGFDMLMSDLARTPTKCQWWPIASRP
ncbi:hypothetical protein [Streptomyces sp. DW26H14]|uniref:hypothetical protein n=1 Tax=Streptomyces sp. DW26H14 TaxID=3435395 RepID=UPI00403D80C0